MILNKKEKRRKRYIALEKEWSELYRQERALPWVEIEPYQDGWTAYIDFREDIKRRSDYPVLQTALDLIKITGRTKNPKVVKGIRNLRRLDKIYSLFYTPKHLQPDPYRVGDMFFDSSKYFVNRRTGSAPFLGKLKVKDWKKQHESVQKWFTKNVDFKIAGEWRERYELNIPKHWLIVKVKPAIVTHIKEIDPVLKKRMAEVETEMDILRNKYHVVHYSGYRDMNRHGNRAHRAHERAALGKIVKGEKDDFEIKSVIRNYD